MGRKDGFSAPVRAELAAEAGQRCANPHCRLRTLGPSDAAATGTANIGVAAHITAAQPGGARYDADMASFVRKSALNGIWLCHTHAHLVDHNSKRYTVRLLCAWKRRSRELTMAELAGQRFVDRSAGLIPHYRRFAEFTKSPEAWRGVCAEMVEDATPKAFWEAQKRELVQLTLYELGLNAFEHGGAQWVSIRSRGSRFELRHTGDRFRPQDLIREPGSGGAETLRQLAAYYPDSVVVRYAHNGRVATTTVAEVSVGGLAGNPCGISDRTLTSSANHQLGTVLPGCSEIHVYVYRHWAYSDAMLLQRKLLELGETRPVVLHGLSPEDHMSDFLRRRMPNARRADSFGG